MLLATATSWICQPPTKYICKNAKYPEHFISLTQTTANIDNNSKTVAWLVQLLLVKIVKIYSFYTSWSLSYEWRSGYDGVDGWIQIRENTQMLRLQILLGFLYYCCINTLKKIAHLFPSLVLTLLLLWYKMMLDKSHAEMVHCYY